MESQSIRVRELGLGTVRVRVVQVVALRTKRGSLSVELRHAAHADEAAAFVSQPPGQWDERGVIAWETGAHHDETLRVGLAGDVQSGRVLAKNVTTSPRWKCTTPPQTI